MKRIIVIAGPTGSGKSEIALNLAKKINGYIINADSKQIYKGISIATAQPKAEKIKKDGTWYIDGIAHYLYGFVSLDSDYNVYKYKADVLKLLKRKDLQDKTPILVGGTGLYIDSVIYNFQMQNTENDLRLGNKSLEELRVIADDKFEKLNESDRNNPRRIARLIERGTGDVKLNPQNHKYFVIDITKEELEERLKRRIEVMFSKGLENEARGLFEKYGENYPESLNLIGFKEFIAYFIGEIDLDEVKEQILIHSRQYAKRQRTWFKRNDRISYVSNLELIIKSLHE